MAEEQNGLAVFEGKQIRRTWHEGEWWFLIIDLVSVMSESNNPRRYWSDLKRKLKNEGYAEVYDKIVPLKMESPNGKMRGTDAANLEVMFRVMQSIPPCHGLPS